MEDLIKNSDKRIIVNPALAFTKDYAMVTVPVNLADGKSSYCVITSKKELFAPTEAELAKRNLCRKVPLYITDVRWSYKSIEKWRKGKIETPDPFDVYYRIKDVFKQYFDYPERSNYSLFSLWTMATYFYPLFPAFPILFLHGTSGSGKSKTGFVMEYITFNGINSSNMSGASIYRLIEGSGCTLILDECEKAASSKDSGDFTNLLLAGFNKNGKVHRVERVNDKEFVTISYSVYSPKIIANIGGIKEEALKNRCITVPMLPSKDEKANLYPSIDDPCWQLIRDSLYIMVMEHWGEVQKIANELRLEDLGLKGYYFMLWHPILTMAKLVSEKTFTRMVKLAKEKMEEREEEASDTIDKKLLFAIQGMLTEKHFVKKEIEGKCFISVHDTLIVMEERMGFSETIPTWFNPYFIGRMMSSLHVGIRKQENIDGKPIRGYWVSRERFKGILVRFGLSIRKQS